MAGRVPNIDFAGLPLGSLPVIVLDTETTGLDVKSARIVQVGAIRLNQGEAGGRAEGEAGAEDRFELLVNPGMPIPPDSTKIHHIADSDVADAPDFIAAIQSFNDWAGAGVLFGWSVGFDLAILKAEHDRHTLTWQKPRSLDVRHLVQFLSPNLPGLSLEIAAAWLGIRVENRHSALGDAETTALIFRALIPKLRDKGIVTLAQAERACRALTRQHDEEARAGYQRVCADRQHAVSPPCARCDEVPAGAG